MSVELAGTTVRAAVEVMAPIEQAFHVFTDDIGSWWNPEHHILQTELAAMVFEPRVGGHVYDAAWTAASAGGRAYSPTSRRTGS